MTWKEVRTVADAHGLALDTVSAANAELRGDLSGRASDRERAVIQRSHDRGDARHDKRRLS